VRFTDVSDGRVEQLGYTADDAAEAVAPEAELGRVRRAFPG
jgi:hypothetical protein